jgi:hypothetical protein
MKITPVSGTALVPVSTASRALVRAADPGGAPVVQNLTAAAAATYRVLGGGAAYPPSSTPSFVLPANGLGYLQLYQTLLAIAVERVYPAPIFSFEA